MDQKPSIQSIITHAKSARKDIENFPRSGLNAKSIAELDLAYNALSDSINHCNTAMKSL